MAKESPKDHVLVVLISCDVEPSDKPGNFIAIRSPVGLESARVDRKVLLDKSAPGQPAAPDIRTIQNRWLEAGKKQDSPSQGMTRLGHDNLCIYAAHITDVPLKHTTSGLDFFEQGTAMCGTTVSGSLISVWRSGDPDIGALLQQVRDLAASISVESAR